MQNFPSDHRRVFLKHKTYGNVFVVQFDSIGEAVLALDVTGEATACKHKLAGTDYDARLSADGTTELNKNLRDFATFEPRCSNAGHWLEDLREAEKLCAEAEAAHTKAAKHAKALKEVFENRAAEIRRIVRESTDTPKALPLFDAAPAQPGEVIDAEVPPADDAPVPPPLDHPDDNPADGPTL
jgi:hypothetical protein